MGSVVKNEIKAVNTVKLLKRRFDQRLRHLKMILLSQRDSMEQEEWLLLLKETKESVIEDPNHFLGDDLPEKDTTTRAIELVFEGFSKDLRIRKIQQSRLKKY